MTIQTTAIPLNAVVTPPPGVVLPPTAPVAAIVAPVLLTIAPTATGTPVSPTSDLVATVLPAINSLTTPGDVVDAVVQLTPSTPDIVAPLVTFQGTQEFEGLMMSRLDDIICGGIDQSGRIASADQEKSYCKVNEPRRDRKSTRLNSSH